jgi:hypothetical protein
MDMKNRRWRCRGFQEVMNPMRDVNHHLWRNGRFWWVAFVALEDGIRQVRVRQSLKTDDIAEARVRRDELIAEYTARAGWAVPLRMQSRGVTGRTILCDPPH